MFPQSSSWDSNDGNADILIFDWEKDANNKHNTMTVWFDSAEVNSTKRLKQPPTGILDKVTSTKYVKCILSVLFKVKLSVSFFVIRLILLC